jgi:hypothetical protein
VWRRVVARAPGGLKVSTSSDGETRAVIFATTTDFQRQKAILKTPAKWMKKLRRAWVITRHA